MSNESIAARGFNRNVFANIITLGNLAKREEIYIVIDENVFYISSSFFCFILEYDSGVLKLQ